MSDYSEELSFVTNLVRDTVNGSIYGKEEKCSIKLNSAGVYDIVTSVDNTIEKELVDRISERYPDDLFICEERNNDSLTDERTWVIDPIDGTVNYNRHIPLFGSQLVLMVGRKPKLSVIYLPALGEMYTASDKGAFLNDTPLKIGLSRKLNECIVALCDFSRKNQYYRDMLAKIMVNMYDNVARFKMFGAACCDFAMVASGKVDLHLRFINNIWDYMPGLFLAEKAGAYIDGDLLDKHNLLVIGSSKSVCDEFHDRVLTDIFEVH